MNVIDAVLLIVLAVAFIFGCLKGLIKSVGAVVSTLAGVLAARELSRLVQPWIAHWFPQAQEGTVRVVAFIAIFLLAALLCSLVFRLIQKLFEAIMLGWLNRLSGGVLSLALAIVVESVALNAYDFLDSQHNLLGEENVRTSQFYTPVKKLLPSVFPSLDMEKWKRPSLEPWKIEALI